MMNDPSQNYTCIHFKITDRHNNKIVHINFLCDESFIWKSNKNKLFTSAFFNILGNFVTFILFTIYK